MGTDSRSKRSKGGRTPLKRGLEEGTDSVEEASRDAVAETAEVQSGPNVCSWLQP